MKKITLPSLLLFSSLLFATPPKIKYTSPLCRQEKQIATTNHPTTSANPNKNNNSYDEDDMGLNTGCSLEKTYTYSCLIVAAVVALWLKAQPFLTYFAESEQPK